MTNDAGLQFPPAFRHLMPDWISNGAPVERNATCTNCAMCGSGARSVVGASFNSETKCCTYHPNLPNYIVGAILEDSSPGAATGRTRVRKAIADRTEALPTGVLQPRKYRLLYYNTPAGFGTAQALICPYFLKETGMCSIWQNREAICATWFCKYENGFDGQLYWEAVIDYMTFVQRMLIHHSLRQLGWPAEHLFSLESCDSFVYKSRETSRIQELSTKLTPGNLDGDPIGFAAHARNWRGWAGREEELYVRCFEQVKKLTQNDVSELGGIELELLEDRIKSRQRKLTHAELPRSLCRNPDMRVMRQPDGRYMLGTYSENDPTIVSADVYNILPLFDGRSTTEAAVQEIESEFGLRLQVDLLKRLHSLRVLVDAEDLKT